MNNNVASAAQLMVCWVRGEGIEGRVVKAAHRVLRKRKPSCGSFLPDGDLFKV